MDQMLERLAGNEYYCFLDVFSGYFQIPIDPKDQEKTTFTCPYGTFAYKRMPFGLCNAPGTFQRCMMAIFHDMIEKTMEVFMDDFLVFENSFSTCLTNLENMLKSTRVAETELGERAKTEAVDSVAKEEDHDVLHFDNSSDLLLSTSLNDLDNATLHINGQSTEVDAPPDIIDLDEDDDISDDEDVICHDLADSDDEDLVNMSVDVARGHDGDDGGDDRPPTHHIHTGYGGCFANRAGRLHTHQETQNIGLKKITDDKGPILNQFEWDDKKTKMPLGDHASHWSNYLGKLIREMPLYYPSWKKVSVKRKAAILTKIGAAHWVINPETGTYDVESIRQRRPENITLADWDAQLAFWNDLRNQARAVQNRQNRAKSTVVCQ
uniref:Reverse transcriptase domain-containing protein n=1 Tax=Tanacetum cinerariifolium TaxID=118510 RepID=A0A6L2N888_TANCI|nr:reverse transcriptase domain-containing protein [Tanacetum cinerariifolium]